jgi:citrate lyase subunit beta/citryl-CoA lyase
MVALSLASSLLFVPGHRPDRFAKAAASGAHAIVLDLEDAVAPADKAAARDAVQQWLQQGHPGVVRINAADTPWHDADVAMLSAFPGAAIMLPKAIAQAAAATIERLPGHSLLALVETVAGIMALPQLAAVPGVVRLAFGSIDFGTETGISDVGEAMTLFRSKIVLASCHARLAAPVDGVSVSLDDEARVCADALRARQLGFTGKLCIHPRQVEAVNRSFQPSEAEQAWAQRVIMAIETSGGAATTVDGKMIDKPVADQARRILRQVAGTV